MVNLVDKVINGIRDKKLDYDINPKHIEQIMASLDGNERSVMEISRLAQVPGATARIILTEIEGMKDSPVKNNLMRFSLVGVEKKEVEKKTDTRIISASDFSKTISSIITILHQRPQTVASLSDELSIDAKSCQVIINKLKDEKAVSVDLSTEWDEPVYILDEKGYSDYLERNKNKAVAGAKKPEISQVAAPVAKLPLKATQKTSNTAKNSTISIEDIVMSVLSGSEKLKISDIVKMTDTAITKMDIESALSSLIKNGFVKSSNPKRKYPFYSLTGKQKAESITANEPVKLNTVKAEPVREDDTKAEAGKIAATKVEANSDVREKTKDAASSEGIKAVEEEIKPKKQGIDTSNKLDEDKISVFAKEVNTKLDTDGSESDDTQLNLSSYADIAALEIALEDVMSMVSESKRKQIKGAIKTIEREKERVKNAIQNLNKTINELF